MADFKLKFTVEVKTSFRSTFFINQSSLRVAWKIVQIMYKITLQSNYFASGSEIVDRVAVPE